MGAWNNAVIRTIVDQDLDRPAVVVGAGFLGYATAGALAASGRPTTLVARHTMVPPPGVQLVQADAADVSALRAAVRPGAGIVYAAGSSVPIAVEDDPNDLTTSLRPLVASLEVARSVGATSFLFMSSGGAVYGDPDMVPVTEGHPLRPCSRYGATKSACEGYVAWYRARYHLAATSLRCGNVYGPGQQAGRGQGLVATVIDAAARGAVLEVWGDGSTVRDYIHIADLTGVICALVGRHVLPTALNVGSGIGTSVREVVEVVTEVMGRPVRVIHRERRPLDVTQVVLDIALLRTLLPFEPVPLADGVRQTWAEWRATTVA